MKSNAVGIGVLLMLLLAAGATFAGEDGKAQPTSLAVPRPRDPWVFRCVLDERPRIVVVALSDEVWAAWDTTTCSLYKAWHGGVNFDGAVYTSVHGPQPTSQGDDLLRVPTEKPWTLLQPGKRDPPTMKWLGYRFDNGQVHLRYQLELGRRSFLVEEIPEVKLDSNGDVEFVRQFWGMDLPRTIRLGVNVPFQNPRHGPLEVRLNNREIPHGINDPREMLDAPISPNTPLEVRTVVYNLHPPGAKE